MPFKAKLSAKSKTNNALQLAAMRVTRIHFVYVAAYMGSIIAFDSWNLLAHDAVAQRWTAAGLLLVANTLLWFLARLTFKNPVVYQTIFGLLIAADIIFAGYNVFWQRGMASKAVMLFVVPIITAAILKSRSALLATATLCTAAYSIAAVRYFNLHYGEGFRIELYGEVGFYVGLFFILAALLMVIIKPDSPAA